MVKLLLIISGFLTSIYSISFNTINGTEQSFSTYQGKKILIVNIATGSNRVGQLAQLEQLYQQYHDSLVVIAFPSNSFGNEPRTNSEIAAFCQANYNTHFLLAEKNAVIGAEQQPLFGWLSSQTANGVVSATIVQDFQKFLIDKNGSLIGMYGQSVEPMDSLIQNSIIGN